MRHASLLAAAAVVLLANATALIHASRNRSGTPDSEVVLTSGELIHHRNPDDTGVALNLNWENPDLWMYSLEPPASDEGNVWLDRARLQTLGFDCSMPPSDPDAITFYNRQIPRNAFVAMELDGPSWRAMSRHGSSRLVPIDASTDPAVLRANHPDRHAVIIVPAVIRINLAGWTAAFQSRPERPARISGSIEQIPASIHVSKPFSEAFRALTPNSPHTYRVHVRYGKLHDPWVTAVDFDKP